MYTSTVANLITRVRDEVDLGSSSTGFVTDSTALSWINSAISWLYGLLITKYGENWENQKQVIYTQTGTQTNFLLPYDFYKPIGVDIALTSATNNWVNAQPYMIRERNMYNGWGAVVSVPYNAQYQFQGNSINWIGSTANFLQFRINYIPAAPYLVNGTQASLLVPSTTTNMGINLTATLAGTSGSLITVTINAPSGATTTVSVSGNAITVNPKTGETNDGLATVLSTNVPASNLVQIVPGGVIGPNDLVAAMTSTALSGGSGNTGVTTFDSLSGYEELIVIEASIRAKDKEESDCTVLLQRKQEWLDRINHEALIRDIAEPMRLVDRYATVNTGWLGGGYGGGGSW
jgi:hypothetical protein